jgi:peptide/nickel transport system substrate-binding protein
VAVCNRGPSSKWKSYFFCIPSPGKVLDLNPYFYIASPPLTHGTILKFLYETLAEETSNGSLEPLLATNWTMSSDGKEIVIKLRENVLWHDGYRFTSADVAFVLYAIKRFPQGDVYSIGGYISTIETPDNYTVKIKLSQPFSRFLYYLLTGYRIFPEHVFKDKDMSNTTVTDMRELVGTGPFKVSEIDLAAQIIRLVAFDRYWG